MNICLVLLHLDMSRLVDNQGSLSFSKEKGWKSRYRNVYGEKRGGESVVMRLLVAMAFTSLGQCLKKKIQDLAKNQARVKCG